MTKILDEQFDYVELSGVKFHRRVQHGTVGITNPRPFRKETLSIRTTPSAIMDMIGLLNSYFGTMDNAKVYRCDSSEAIVSRTRIDLIANGNDETITFDQNEE